MKSFGKIENIPPGSVFLSNGCSRFSRLIRAISRGNYQRDTYTHAGIYVGGPRHLIAHQLVGLGSTIQSFEEEIRSAQSVSVWAPISPQPDIAKTCMAVSVPYSFKTTIKRMFGRSTTLSDGLYCTEGVLTVYKFHNAPILGNRISGVTPNELRDALEYNPEWRLVYKTEKERK